MNDTAASSPAFLPLPLGAVRPRGWLLDQLRIQADGLSGHLDEFWPSIAQSKWIGGDADGWERGPYWLDGIVPLAVLLQDERLLAKVRHWMDYILAHQHEDGWLGPKDDIDLGATTTHMDPWPMYVLFKAFAQWHEATGDERILPAMTRALRRIDTQTDTDPLTSWAKMRWMDLAWGIHWLHARTGEDWLLALAAKVQAQGYDWHAHFAPFTLTEKCPQWTLEDHVVNHAMALKEPAMRLPFSSEGVDTARAWMATLDRYHGQATGVFSGDESLAGPSPSQGTELCAVVEYLFSLELLVAAFGDVAFADRLERIAYNALPATFTTDMWAHQYVQQANQVVCRVAPDGERIYTNNGPEANLFGLEPHFGCCTANFHQGWPKLVSHLWMATPDGGLAAVVHGPSEVRAKVGKDNVDVRITVETEYPFDSVLHITIHADAPVKFPLYVRIPQWAEGSAFQRKGSFAELAEEAGNFDILDREWQPGDSVTFYLGMEATVERRFNGAATIARGPLVYSLAIGEDFRYHKGEPPHADYQVFPTTPWNYALALPNGKDSIREQDFTESPVGSRPFAPESAPVRLTVPARRLPEWGLRENCADAPPPSPVTAAEAADATLEQITLVPYGCTHLRVTEFPVVADAEA